MNEKRMENVNGVILNGEVHVFINDHDAQCDRCSLAKQCDNWDERRSMCELFGQEPTGHYEKRGEILPAASLRNKQLPKPMNEIDFNEFAHNVNQRLNQMGRERKCSLKEMKMRIVRAIMDAVEMPSKSVEAPKVDYSMFSDKGESFESAYKKTVEGTLYDIFAGVAIECLDLIAERDIHICDMDQFMLRTAPKALGTPASGDNLNEFLYDAVATLFHIRENEASVLECIKMWEKNPADKELEEIINEEFGDVEFPEDIEIRTSYGYENFIVLRKVLVVLNMVAAWFKNRGGKDMVWHINAKLYYMAETAK